MAQTTLAPGAPWPTDTELVDAIAMSNARASMRKPINPKNKPTELQATRVPLVGKDNPINILIAEYNASIEKHNSEMQRS